MALHRLLSEDEDAAPIFEWWISRICEEFTCVPSVAYQEWLSSPAGLLETILEYRAYAHAKALYDGATTSKAKRSLPQTRIMGLVERNEFDLAEEWRARRAGITVGD